MCLGMNSSCSMPSWELLTSEILVAFAATSLVRSADMAEAGWARRPRPPASSPGENSVNHKY